MNGKIITIATATAGLILLAFSSLASADIVQLDLFDLGCQTIYDFNSPSWTANFDLKVTFAQISNVYMDWSGKITAGLAVQRGSAPFPLDVGIGAYLGSYPDVSRAATSGGELTYPDAELFDCWSEFDLLVPSDLSDLLDGRSTILIEYEALIILDGSYVQHGSIVLDSAILVIDGLLLPEPATVLFLIVGIGAIRAVRPKSSRQRFIVM